MYFVVLVMVLVVGGLMWFFFASAIQSVQEGVKDNVASNQFASEGNWDIFNYANIFMNNLWTFLLVFVVIGLAYYGYVEAQRRGIGI